MRALRPATPATRRRIEDALQLMRRARKLLREAGCAKASQKVNSTISSAKGARRHCDRRPIIEGSNG